MNLSETIKILAALAEGVNPITGEILAPGQPFEEPSVIRALYTAVQHLRQVQAKAEQSVPSPPKAYQAWNVEEDQELIRQFNANIPIKTIADSHGRTRGAIQSRLIRLGLIDPPLSPQPLDAKTPPTPQWWKEQGRTQVGKAWTLGEDEALLRDFRSGIPLEELASRLKRGVNAVEVRLVKLGVRANPGKSDKTSQ